MEQQLNQQQQSYFKQAHDSRFFGKDLSNFANSQTISMEAVKLNYKISGNSMQSNEKTISHLSTQNSDCISKKGNYIMQASSSENTFNLHQNQQNNNDLSADKEIFYEQKNNLNNKMTSSIYIEDLAEISQQQKSKSQQEFNQMQNNLKQQQNEENELDFVPNKNLIQQFKNQINHKKVNNNKNYVNNNKLEEEYVEEETQKMENEQENYHIDQQFYNNNKKIDVESNPQFKQQQYQKQQKQQNYMEVQEEGQNARNFNDIQKNIYDENNNQKIQNFNSFQNINQFIIPSNNKSQQQYQKKKLTLEEFSHYLEQKQNQDPQQVTEYSHQIIKYLQSIESNYLPSQYLVNVIRASIVDWVIEVSDFFKLKCETIHIAINIYDRFIAQRKDIKTLDQPIHQIIGGTALFMAAKYEEIYPPSLGDFARRMNFKKQDMVNIEGKIISKIGFTLTSPTSLKFMEAYSQFQALSEQQNNLARFLLQLGLHDPQLYNQKPSLIASASILTVKKMKNMELTNFWEEDMIQLTGYQQSELENVANVLFNLLLQIQNSQGSAVFIKFNTPQFQNVSQCIQANFQE